MTEGPVAPPYTYGLVAISSPAAITRETTPELSPVECSRFVLDERCA